MLIRPVGRPPKRPVILYDDFWYRAGSWDRARRVVAKVEWHRGELFPRVGFIVTNMTADPEGVVRFYNGRGTAEQWIKEGKYALNWTRLSCHRFVANRVRLSLFVLAYNLGNFLRRLCLPKAVKHWSLRSVQVKLIKMGGRLVRHSRWLIFQLWISHIGSLQAQGQPKRDGSIIVRSCKATQGGWPRGGTRSWCGLPPSTPAAPALPTPGAWEKVMTFRDVGILYSCLPVYDNVILIS